MSFVSVGLISSAGCCLVVYHNGSCHQLCCPLSLCSASHPGRHHIIKHKSLYQ